MSTLNGFGTLYYGWRHFKGGTATATKWFALSWIPVVPLYRQRLRVLTDFENDKSGSSLGGFAVAQRDTYQVLERLPLSVKEIVVTLAKTYMGLPLILFGPMLLVSIIFKLLRQGGIVVEPGSPAFAVFLAGIALSFVNFLWQVVLAIRRARGWQP
jgi:hypothetical protein